MLSVSVLAPTLAMSPSFCHIFVRTWLDLVFTCQEAAGLLRIVLCRAAISYATATSPEVAVITDL